MEKFIKTLVGVVIVLAATVLAAFIEGVFVMWLWNWLMPMIFGLTTISYIEGFGISFLCGMLFTRTVNKEKD